MMHNRTTEQRYTSAQTATLYVVDADSHVVDMVRNVPAHLIAEMKAQLRFSWPGKKVEQR